MHNFQTIALNRPFSHFICSLLYRYIDLWIPKNICFGFPDDCVPQAEEPCEEPSLLSQIVTTTSTTTTTTTTQRPCSPKPHCMKPTRAPCYPMPCPAIPLAIPVCQMCPMAGSVATAPNPSALTLPHEQKLLNSVTASTDPVFFYVGVPKKVLKDLRLLNNS